MIKHLPYLSTLIAMLLGAFLPNAAQASIKELVDAGKISWEGAVEELWVGDGGSQLLLKFTDTTPGTCSFTLAEGIKANVRVVAVGGGGAGGVSHDSNIGAGGGGAGGLTNLTVDIDGATGGSTWDITVGAGGACPLVYTTQVVGNNGSPSSFGSLVSAPGGGGGGSGTVGNDGACGGGGSYSSAAQSGGTGSVGKNGGSSTRAKFGGGGGGMGSVGKNSSSSAGGGGAGVENDITDISVYYCAGGAGGSLGTKKASGGSSIGGNGGSSSVESTAGLDGTGSGGGGSGSLATDLGGKGGDGVVFVRILTAYDSVIAKPIVKDLTYRGDNQVAFVFDRAYQYVSGVTNAIIVGDYSFVVKPGDGFKWKDDGTTDNYTVKWKIVPMEIDRPVAPTGFVYNGSEQVAAYDKKFYYTFAAGSVTKATNAGSYSFTAVLNDKVNTCWDDKTTDDLKVDWSIASKAVVKPTVPTGIEYSGTNSVAFAPGEGYAYVGGTTNSVNAGNFEYRVQLNNPANATNYVWSGEGMPAAVAELTNKWNIASKKIDRPEAYTNLMYNATWQNGYKKLELEYYDVAPEENTNRLEAGSYDVTFSLKNPVEAKNYTWKVDPPTTEDDWDTSWSIAKATNAVTNLKISGWKIGSTPIAPTCDALWGKETVKYDYSMNPEEGPWETAAALTNAGTWYVRAIVPEAKNWLAATNMTDFFLFDDPQMVYAYSVEITFSNTGSATTDYQALIEISPETLHGFSYDDAGEDGKTLFVIGPDGNPLAYKVVTWNVNGTSKLGLLIKDYPVGNTTVTLYWGVRPGQTAPKYDDTGVKPPTKATTVTFSLVKHDGKMINYWVKEPVITPTSWDVDAEEKGKVVELGQLAVGAVSNYYYDVYAPTNVYSDISQLIKAGYYRAVFTQKDPEGYEPIEKEIDLRVTASDPYIDIGGVDGDSGRILLMNNDTIASTPIRYQGYADTDITKGTYWVISGGEKSQGGYGDLGQHYTNGYSKVLVNKNEDFNIKVGRSSTLMKSDGSRLWHLNDCRHGNTYVYDPDVNYSYDLSLFSKRNFLGFSGTSRDINRKWASRTYAAKKHSAGQIVMRNRETAAVYSPCFTNGFGTLYFDAVNGWVNDGSGYKIAVEWATNAVDVAGKSYPALDENCYTVEEGVTNWYAKAVWHDAEMIAYKRDGKTEFDPPVRTTELPLAVTTGGSDQYFYRIAVPLNFEVPARIRIVRRSTDSSFRTHDEEEKPEGGSTDVYGYDNGGFVLLDNLIVSYPPMWAEMAPLSKLDETRHGKQALGYEISTTVPYPAVGEANALMRAKVIAHVNDGKKDVRPEQFVSGAKAHYRWRYLNQKAGAWKELDLNPMNDYQSMSPVEIPALPGDIEYWLDCNLQAPFYSYVDYSGLNLGIPYSEARKTAVSGLNAKTEIISGGTNWFFRLREGKSDRQGVKVVVEGELKGEYELSLIGDHSWRGFIPNPSNAVGKCTFKFVGYNLQTPGALEYATNSVVWGAAGGYTVKELPANGKLDVDGDDIAFTVSHLANYYEVRLNEETLTWSFSTAEYQDFNKWDDAKGTKFVGSSAMGNRRGVAPTKTTLTEDFDDWGAMSSTSTNWTLFSFADLNSMYGSTRTPYKQQASDTDGAWSIGPGMWVAKYYADRSEKKKDGKEAESKGSGVAYQMKGCGEGFVQYTEKDNAPRGIESISFNARLGQYIDFTDFSYYDGEAKSKMTNYVFTARGAFDHNNNQDFSGNASLSLVAYYREKKGCYEARWEQLTGKWTKKYSEGGTCSGIDPYGQRLCLYRWYCDPNTGKMDATLLGAWTNSSSSKVTIATGTNTTDKSENKYLAQPLMITVENTADGTRVAVGVASSGDGVTFGQSYSEDQKRKWYGFCVVDNDAKKLTSGTYGLLTANCPGRFNTATAYKYDKPIGWAGFELKSGKTSGTYEAKDLSTYFPKTTPTSTQKDFEDEYWIVTPGRMAYVRDKDKGYYFLESKAAPQSVNVWTALAGKSDWKLLKTIDVGNSFGKGGTQSTHTLKLYTTTNSSVRISTGGVFGDPRNDVIIDSVVIKQFRGNDYSDSKEMTESVGGKQRIPTWHDPADTQVMTNFVFTSAWIKNDDKRTAGTILLSARRTMKDKISGVRSPVLDGNWKRGKGLGMFAFDYQNAQANAKLLVQIATNNVSAGTICNYDDKLGEGYWVTYDTIDFSKPGAKLSSGTCSYYFGIHDKAAAVRVIVDPETVAKVASQTDTSKFGEVEITKVLIRDEPGLGPGCWTGWNLRMIAVDDKSGGDTEKRMYLPDYAVDEIKDRGMSAALNKSVTDDVDDPTDITYKQNVPFVESPKFGEGIIGEVTFKARKYGEKPTAQPANVRLYGSKTGDPDSTWEVIGDIPVTNEVFTSYSYRVDSSRMFKAFRLGVTGAAGVNPEVKGVVRPEGYDNAVRVLLDEVAVSQAIQVRMAFRNVGAFRSFMQTRETVPNVPSAKEQPLCNEGWGVQCEVYAAQQSDEINFDIEPIVYLHYFVGDVPWGYENWVSNRAAKTVRLPMSVDSNLVYRSTYLGNYANTVVPMSTMPGEVVQYTLEVRYWKKGSMTALTNFLTAAEWTRPEWYRPLDLNAQYGDGKVFAAYNILDTVAPDWAWINEANIYGKYLSNWKNTERDAQFVEVAVPMEADISGWSVRLIGANVWNDAIVTNTIGRFGKGTLPGMKKNGGLYAASNMVFRVLGSPDSSTKAGGKLNPDDGQLDDTWTFQQESDTFLLGGEIFATDPFGIQLVRASGIIEHEVICVGTNFYGSMPGLQDYYAPSNTVNFLNSRMKESRFFYAGQDSFKEGCSLGVFVSHGENTNCWNNTMTMTPGRINFNQSINPDHPTPNGETILIYANVDNSVGHIVQTVGDAVETNASVTVFIRRGSQSGTNITYKVDPWYELGSVTQNGKDAPFGPLASPKRTYVATVGVGASNNVTVIATAKPKASLANLGITADNPYASAVMRWLSKHQNAYGTGWADPESEEVKLAQYISMSGHIITNMTLTQMYWLDMDPTVGDLALRAGMVKPPAPTLVDGYKGTAADTNVEMSVYMMITNRTTDTTSKQYGRAWTPYILRGLAPDETSWNYGAANGGWTSVTFKVTGILANGHTSEDLHDDWIPLRWFVFLPDSFIPRGQPSEGTSVVQVRDPYSKRSPGYTAGWYAWKQKYGEVPIFFSWALDTRLQPVSVEFLKQENKYDD